MSYQDEYDLLLKMIDETQKRILQNPKDKLQLSSELEKLQDEFFVLQTKRQLTGRQNRAAEKESVQIERINSLREEFEKNPSEILRAKIQKEEEDLFFPELKSRCQEEDFFQNDVEFYDDNLD